ncbi:MAG: Ldh family oxidoreductase [Betaproteobacteria bacterium]|nr:Ldh family oxidoreductase [Betaproteobacteria bacterium]
MTAPSAEAAAARRISPERLCAFVSRVYRSTGVPAGDADFLADTLVQADLWGHQSHGVLRTSWYYDKLVTGAMKAVTKTETVVDAGAIAVIDGHDGVGQVIARQAAEEAVRRAKAHGVGVVSVRNSGHFGTCMYYTGSIARQGCVAILATNGGPNMPPWGGLGKLIGTNPWSVAAPAGRHAPMIMDIAVSGVARGKVYLARQRHEKIPDTWALDKDGNPTTDPAAALEGYILPMAGHKGYAIGVIVDMLAGVLSGSGFLDGVHGPYDPVNPSRAGHFFAAFDVTRFQPREQFDARMEEYIAKLKSVPLAPGHEAIFYPGEIEARADERNRQAGLALPADTLADLARVAGLAGLADFTLEQLVL